MGLVGRWVVETNVLEGQQHGMGIVLYGRSHVSPLLRWAANGGQPGGMCSGEGEEEGGVKKQQQHRVRCSSRIH
jgi:hypothetical protein